MVHTVNIVMHSYYIHNLSPPLPESNCYMWYSVSACYVLAVTNKLFNSAHACVLQGETWAELDSLFFMNQIKKADVGFAQVKNEVLFDSNLSLKAKGLFAYLYAKPDDWQFSGDRMVKETKDGRKAVYSALQELEDNGYLQREKQPDGRMIYNLTYEKPIAQNGQEAQKPIAQKGKLPKRQVAERGSINNKENSIQRKKEHTNTYGEFGNVKLSEEEQAKLHDKYEATDVRGMITELDLYIESSGKKYKSHYATLLNWAKRKQVRQKMQQEHVEEVSEEDVSRNMIALRNLKEQYGF